LYNRELTLIAITGVLVQSPGHMDYVITDKNILLYVM
jgi:hypothetical protein